MRSYVCTRDIHKRVMFANYIFANITSFAKFAKKFVSRKSPSTRYVMNGNMAAGAVIRAKVLHSSRGKCEECASGSGFFVHVGNTPVIVTTASWLMHLWELKEDLHSSNLER